jgi:hypothetical protein
LALKPHPAFSKGADRGVLRELESAEAREKAMVAALTELLKTLKPIEEHAEISREQCRRNATHSEFIREDREDFAAYQKAKQDATAALSTPPAPSAPTLRQFLERQIPWSRETFGAGPRVGGVTKHIEKEVQEIRENPTDLSEWIDVVILALDGAWRAGHTAEQVEAALFAKQEKNMAREWPPPTDDDTPNEHVRTVAACQCAELREALESIRKAALKGQKQSDEPLFDYIEAKVVATLAALTRKEASR